VIAENGDKEGIPGTIIEAMSCGLPIVSTYHAGIPYVIENNKTGLLVKEWDLDALGTAIKSTIDSQALRKKLVNLDIKFQCRNSEKPVVNMRHRLLISSAKNSSASA